MTIPQSRVFSSAPRQISYNFSNVAGFFFYRKCKLFCIEKKYITYNRFETAGSWNLTNRYLRIVTVFLAQGRVDAPFLATLVRWPETAQKVKKHMHFNFQINQIGIEKLSYPIFSANFSVISILAPKTVLLPCRRWMSHVLRSVPEMSCDWSTEARSSLTTVGHSIFSPIVRQLRLWFSWFDVLSSFLIFTEMVVWICVLHTRMIRVKQIMNWHVYKCVQSIITAIKKRDAYMRHRHIYINRVM